MGAAQMGEPCGPDTSPDSSIPFLVVFGSQVGLQVGGIDEVPPTGVRGEGE